MSDIKDIFDSSGRKIGEIRDHIDPPPRFVDEADSIAPLLVFGSFFLGPIGNLVALWGFQASAQLANNIGYVVAIAGFAAALLIAYNRGQAITAAVSLVCLGCAVMGLYAATHRNLPTISRTNVTGETEVARIANPGESDLSDVPIPQAVTAAAKIFCVVPTPMRSCLANV